MDGLRDLHAGSAPVVRVQDGVLSITGSTSLKDKEGNTQLHLLCAVCELPNKVVAEVKNLLTHPEVLAQLNRQNNKGYSPLHLAVKAGNVALATLLLSFGADIKMRDRKRRTALHWAVTHTNNSADPTLLDTLLSDEHIEVNAIDNASRTALHVAGRLQSLPAITALLRHPQTVADQFDINGQLPLNTYLSSVKDEAGPEYSIVAQFLAHRDTSTSAQDFHDNTGLHTLIEWCINNPRAEPPSECISLLKAGTSIEHIPNSHSQTPLNMATAAGRDDLVNLLRTEVELVALSTSEPAEAAPPSSSALAARAPVRYYPGPASWQMPPGNGSNKAQKEPKEKKGSRACVIS